MKDYTEILTKICANSNAHFVLVRDGKGEEGKRPIASYNGKTYSWSQHKDIPPEALNAHLQQGYLLGVIPKTVNSFVVDADFNKANHIATNEDKDDLGISEMPFLSVKTKTPNSYHHYFGCTLSGFTKTSKWKYGDFIYSKGYVILWNIDRVLPAILQNLVNPKAKHTLQNFPVIREAKSSPNVKSDKGYTPGNRNNQLNKDCYLAGKSNDQEARKQFEQYARKAGLPESEIESTSRSGYSAGVLARQVEDEKDRNKTPLNANKIHIDITQRNITLHELCFEELNFKLRFNKRSNRAEQKIKGKWKPLRESTKKAKYAEILSNITYNKYLKSKDEFVETPVKFTKDERSLFFAEHLERRRIDTFNQGLLNIEKSINWDGIERVNNFLIELFFDEIPVGKFRDLVQWASRFLFLGSIRRTFEPGCKLDETPIFVGDQGIGKSTLLAFMFPEEAREQYFGDELNFHSSNKQMIESLLGKVLVEIPELTGLSKADLSKVKSFLTRQNDQVRLAYRKDVESLPRRCIVVGTTNDVDCLPNDPSGNRRLVAIQFERGYASEVREYLSKYRLQLWREALHIYRQNSIESKAYLPVELHEIQAEVNAEHKKENTAVVDLINLLGKNDITGFTSTGISQNLRDHDDVGDNVIFPSINQFAPALRARGYIQKFIDRQKRWFKAKNTAREIEIWRKGEALKAKAK